MYPAAAQAPVESGVARTLQGRADQQDPPRCRPQVPPAGVRRDRGAGGRQSAVHPRAQEDTGPGARRSSPHPAWRDCRGQGPTPPTATAPTSAFAVSRQSFRRRRTKPPAGRSRRAARAAGPLATTPTCTRAEHRRAPDQQAEAWRGIAIRYDKTPASYLAGLHLRAAVIWIRDRPDHLDHN